uniref:Uncharacterized protein n=1 Tax=Clastoptera arizonana TaxID=38151 RepID=A0A1B6CW69_9HEMI
MISMSLLVTGLLLVTTVSAESHHYFEDSCPPRPIKGFHCGVAKCTENLLSRALPNFDMNELTGPYNYAYSTSLYSSKCAIGDVYGNLDTRLSASALLVDKLGGWSQKVFNFSLNEDGTMDETRISDDGRCCIQL